MALWSIIMLHFGIKCKYLIFMNGSLISVCKKISKIGGGSFFFWLPEIFSGYQLFFKLLQPWLLKFQLIKANSPTSTPSSRIFSANLQHTKIYLQFGWWYIPRLLIAGTDTSYKSNIYKNRMKWILYQFKIKFIIITYLKSKANKLIYKVKW